MVSVQGQADLEQPDRYRCESAMNWRRIVASRHCPLSPAHRWVITCLSYYGNRYGDRIFPSQATVVERTGTSRKTVSEATRRAYEARFLDRWQKGTGQGYKRYEYTLTLPYELATDMTLNPDFMKELQSRGRTPRG